MGEASLNHTAAAAVEIEAARTDTAKALEHLHDVLHKSRPCDRGPGSQRGAAVVKKSQKRLVCMRGIRSDLWAQQEAEENRQMEAGHDR